MHLSANLINDYSDSMSTADWQDKTFYGFFGGSKLIQEGVLPEKFYLKSAIVFAVISFLAIISLAIILKSLLIISLFLIILFLSWSYSIKPLQLVYHYLGEIIIFVLFGPALVMGGYFLQTGTFPDLKSFLLSLPFGLLTTAILYVNEIPDRADDEKAGKFTWASIVKAGNSYLIYCTLIILAFVSIVFNVIYGLISSWALISFVAIFPVIKAVVILKKWPNDKVRLVESSKLTIVIQSVVSLILIVGIML
jgi:1,4-dihydroxy-2-naphthoate octaprenyltransferase